MTTPSCASDTPPVLQAREISKSYGSRLALESVGLCVQPGQFVALLGPNGAGKTTTLRMVAGLTQPDSGEVAIFGVDARKDPAGAKAVLAWAPDEAMIYDKLTPLEYLEFVAGLWNIEPKAAKAKAEQLLETLGLTSEARRRCEGFSRGMKQKTSLAGALIHDPKLLMLDEPLTGLDAAIARQVKDLLSARVRQGATIILTTHILDVAERMAERIGIIQHGKLLAEGTLADLRGRAGGGSASLEDVYLQLVGAAA